MTVRTTSFLEELKAAQRTISCFDRDYWYEFFSYDLLTVKEVTQLEAVLRRIPQLIETIEWVKAKEDEYQKVFEKYLFEAPETAKKCEAKAIFARELLSKLSNATADEVEK